MSYILAVIFAVLIVVGDQISKHLVVANMTFNEPIVIIDKILNLRFIYNDGAAFGMMKGKTWFFLAATAVILVICVSVLVRKTFDSKMMFWAICLVMAGGVGNLIDRLFRHGKVVDFFEVDFINFPIFNVADIAVCCGVGLIIFYFIVDMYKDIKKGKPQIESYAQELENVVDQNNDGEQNCEPKE